MNFLFLSKVALRSLLRAPVRSALTTLGIVIGVAAVISTVSIGLGARARIEETLAKPESRLVYVGATPRAASTSRFDLSPADRLNVADYYAIRDSTANLSSISPKIYIQAAQAAGNGRVREVLVEGLDVDGLSIEDRSLREGEFFTRADVHRAVPVGLLTESLAEDLYAEEPATGRIIRINGIPVYVIGIVTDVRTGNPRLVDGKDVRIIIPFTSLLRRMDRSAQLAIVAQARGIDHVGRVQQEISDLMEARRAERKADFPVSSALESIRAYATGSKTMARLLAAISAISLVVGGIGIMNIMLATVTERTREIGIRLAVGTRSRDILRQFLIEAAVLSSIGGIIGVVLGICVSMILSGINDWPTRITPMSVLSAFLCSLLVGVFFGYHPARRAALCRPIEALRTE